MALKLVILLITMVASYGSATLNFYDNIVTLGTNGINYGFVPDITYVPPVGGGWTNQYSTGFDGVNDYALAGGSGALNAVRSGRFAVSLWFKRPVSTVNCSLFDSSYGVGGYQGGVYARWFSSSAGGGNANFLDVYAGTLESGGTWNGDTNWHHLVVIRGATSHIFVDGAVVFNVTFGNVSGTTNIYIGAAHTGYGPMKGNIDEVSILVGDSITTNCVGELYAARGQYDLSSLNCYTNIVAHWRMGDGDTANTILDVVGTNNATMYGMSQTNFVTDVP